MDKIWYYRNSSGEKYGPYTEEELIRLIQQQILSPDDGIWMVDLETWIPLMHSIYSFYMPSEQ